MGLYDRDYTREDFHAGPHYSPQMRLMFPRMTPMVKRLLIINAVVFIAGIVFFAKRSPFEISWLEKWFAVYPYSVGSIVQLWRLVTYQFLHADIWHIIFNMLGLFFLGPTLERHWGSRRFLLFYLGCGAAGGAFYMFLVVVRFLPAMPMIGASGAILGMLAACAILFPHFVVFIFLFPVPIRVAAILFTAVYIVAVLTRAENAGGHAAHLAGMAAGAFYVVSERWRSSLMFRFRRGAWKKRIAAEQRVQQEADRILQKIHEQGLQSLTRKEKKILRQVTEAEQLRGRL